MLNLLAASLLTIASADVSVSTLSNQQFSGTLVEFSSDRIVVDTGKEKKAFSPDHLLRVAPKQSAKSSFEGTIVVELVDGSRIRAVSYEVANRKVMIGVAGGKIVETQTRDVLHVLLRSQINQPELQQQWQQILEEKLVGDTIVVRKVIKGESEGQKRTELRPVEGILFDVSSESLQFKFAGEMHKVGREKTEGLIYYHAAGRELPEAICRVDDIHGSRWQARSLSVSGSNMNFTTSAGVEQSLPIAHIRNFDFARGKIVLLSDLTPAAVRWRPFYGSGSASDYAAKLNEPQVDQSFAGTKLAVLAEDGRIEFERGLAIRSHTSLLFVLPDEYKRFVATVGLEPERGRSGNVRLRIIGNGKSLYEDVIRGDETSKNIDIPIAGVRRLGIVVEFGDNLTIGDYLHLCDAKVRK